MKKQKDGVFVILPFGENHVWMVRHNYKEKLWSLPGGGVENGQTFQTAAERECLEETSLNIKLQRKLGVFTGKQSKQIAELWEGKPKHGFDAFSGIYENNEILCHGIIPLDLPLDFPIYRAQRMFLQVYKLAINNQINISIEDWMSAPFKNEPLQNWYENLHNNH